MAGDLSPLDFGYIPGAAAEVIDSTPQRGHTQETWRLVGSLGEGVLADAYLSPESGPVVIAGHGRDNSRKAQYLRGPGMQWARKGISLVAADAPLHGDRAGERPVPRVAITDVELLTQWVRDQRLLIDAVEARFGEGVPIIYLGVSMGAVLGCHLLAADERPLAGILVVGGSTVISIPERFDDVEDLAELLLLTDPTVPAARIAPRPVLMMNAEDDEVFSHRSAMALYDALGHPKEISFIPGGHSRWRSPSQWNRRMLGFAEHVFSTASQP